VPGLHSGRRIRGAAVNKYYGYYETWGAGAAIPRFWLGAGTSDKQDVANAEFFRQELQLRQADVPLALTPGGGHNMATWRAEVPLLLR
jgi:hypothetical protein